MPVLNNALVVIGVPILAMVALVALMPKEYRPKMGMGALIVILLLYFLNALFPMPQ